MGIRRQHRPRARVPDLRHRQFQAFQRAYSNLTHPPSYLPPDFGKPNDTQAVARTQTAAAKAFWKRTSSSSRVSRPA
jgi:hypothetical protein